MSNSVKTAPYGTWTPLISPEQVAAASGRIQFLQIDHHHIYFLEQMPQENGRQVIQTINEKNSIQTLTPPGFNVRTRVHEYGGGDYLVQDGMIYFSSDTDQRLYQQVGEKISAITPLPFKEKTWRYSDYCLTASQHYLIAVRERHHETHQVINDLICIHTTSPYPLKSIASGADFYASPRLSPNNKQLAWIQWNAPQMPWDGTELWVADFNADGTLKNPQKMAGSTEESILQPAWSPEGILHFISDRSGWWNLYRVNSSIEAVAPLSAECAYPPWIFATKTYDFFANGDIALLVKQKEKSSVAWIKKGRHKIQFIDTPWTSVSPRIGVKNEEIIAIVSSAKETPSLVAIEKNGRTRILYQKETLHFPQDILSSPEFIEFPTNHEETAYGFYYPPHNPHYQAPENDLPPLLVMSHGGPTGEANTEFNLKIQFWTSCGFAVMDVNYRGSTGYGRAYRDRLKGQWGVIDVMDCIKAAQFCVQTHRAHPQHLFIRGGSAGGYTTLCALTSPDNIFSAGASYYGVSDLKALVDDTHKFEAHYLESLIGPYSTEKALYTVRSPLSHTDQLSCPIIFFQGLQDKIVPPEQAEKMIEAMQKKGISYEYITFDNEDHGFREAKNIALALEKELAFYRCSLSSPT